jgi:2-C-methyl-D-erythritol 4-phosphate cytidylyltransferase
MKNIAIILAGGSGTRFNGKEPKQFLAIKGKTLLEICLQKFHDHAGIDGIILICPASHLAQAERIAAGFSKIKKVLPGAATRQGSSAVGVKAAFGAENVLIHDAARALVAAPVISRVLAALADGCAVMPVIAVNDTTVRVDGDGLVAAVLDRDKLRCVQTPQGFKADIMRRAHELADSEGHEGAGDDCSLVLRYKLGQVVTVAGDAENIKITYPLDLSITDSILKNRRNK